jgi:hypothetical protein
MITPSLSPHHLRRKPTLRRRRRAALPPSRDFPRWRRGRARAHGSCVDAHMRSSFGGHGSLSVEHWLQQRDGSRKRASSRDDEETFMACGRVWCILQACVPRVSDVSEVCCNCFMRILHHGPML